MFARNLQAGEYVTLVPLGLPITIQYSERGPVDKVYTGHEENQWKDVTNPVLTKMLINKQIPNHANTNGRICYVRAVLYSSELQFNRGIIPNCVMDKYLQAYMDDPNRFSVYAGDMHGIYDTVNMTAVATNQWLVMNQFATLPGFVIPTEFDESKFESMAKRNFPFRYPLIASYIVFHRDSSVTYPKTGLTMFQVDSVKCVVDQCGNILGDVKEKSSDTVHSVPYPQVVHNDIQKNSNVVCNSEGNFIYVQNEIRANKLPRKITCSSCGKQLIVPSANVRSFKCEDPQCNSVLYPRVVQMLNTLGLPTMSFDRYTEVTKEIGNIFGILDVLELDEYKDTEIEVTLEDAARAIIPKDVLPGSQQIKELCIGCANSEEAYIYYVTHPETIVSDLGLNKNAFSRLIAWLNVPENSSDCVELLHLSNVQLIKTKKHIDGSPIFRDKKIYITGTFFHGTTEDIISILEGYSATVYTKFDQSVDCVVVGDVPENVNGHAIGESKKLNIPIMEESDFFSTYRIDSDIVQ